MKTLTVTKAELAFQLGHSMHELRNHIRQHIQVKIREHGVDITFEMLEVMSFLWKNDGSNQQEIADQTLRDKSSMTYLIDNLAKRGLVGRVEDGNDRRNKLIFLTDKGKALKDQLYPWATEVYENATADLQLDRLQDAVLLLNEMVSSLKNR
ncbi:MAG: MarR family transcriptional regulator [Sphingobacteriaceae bacterium]|nr:MAG: MarR family transcriptional regulator [Sphingobacteriaceae bacterium]